MDTSSGFAHGMVWTGLPRLTMMTFSSYLHPGAGNRNNSKRIGIEGAVVVLE